MKILSGRFYNNFRMMINYCKVGTQKLRIFKGVLKIPQQFFNIHYEIFLVTRFYRILVTDNKSFNVRVILRTSSHVGHFLRFLVFFELFVLAQAIVLR